MIAMPIVLTEIENGIGVALTCSGIVTGQEMIEANMVLLSMGTRVRDWRFCVVDHTAVQSVDYSPEDVQITADLDHAIALNTRKGMLVAIVAPSDVQFGFAQMWRDLARRTGWETMVVRTREQAEEWIRTKSAIDIRLSNTRSAIPRYN